jgi:hypothetical protein
MRIYTPWELNAMTLEERKAALDSEFGQSFYEERSGFVSAVLGKRGERKGGLGTLGGAKGSDAELISPPAGLLGPARSSTVDVALVTLRRGPRSGPMKTSATGQLKSHLFRGRY